MVLWELFLISLALSLDAFSVALSCGMRLPADRYRKFLKIALAFGIFQAVMPLLGSVLSKYFLAQYIARYSGWISFLVFGALGAKTFYDFFTSGKEEAPKPCTCAGYRCLMSLAVSVTWIGIVTFVNSLVGCFLGNKAVGFLNRYARLMAGVILVALAIKALF